MAASGRRRREREEQGMRFLMEHHLALQAFVLDPLGSGGFSMTNGVRFD